MSDLTMTGAFFDLDGSNVEFATSGSEVVIVVREAHGEPHRIRLGPDEQEWFARHFFAAVRSAEGGSDG